MDIQAFGLGQGVHIDTLLDKNSVESYLDSTVKIASTLETSRIRVATKSISKINDGEYKIILGRNLTASQALLMLRASSEDKYDIEYSDDIDESELIHITGKPLWSVKKNGNVLQIQRVN